MFFYFARNTKTMKKTSKEGLGSSEVALRKRSI